MSDPVSTVLGVDRLWGWGLSVIMALLSWLGLRTINRVDALEKTTVTLAVHNATVTALREDIKALATTVREDNAGTHRRMDRMLERMPTTSGDC